MVSEALWNTLCLQLTDWLSVINETINISLQAHVQAPMCLSALWAGLLIIYLELIPSIIIYLFSTPIHIYLLFIHFTNNAN